MAVTALTPAPSLTTFGDTLDRVLASSRNAARTMLVNGGAAPVQSGGATVANRCAHCGGRFGMVTHRWWGNKFCKRACKNAYLRELALGRDKIRRWFGFPRAGWRLHELVASYCRLRAGGRADDGDRPRTVLKESVRKIPCARQAWSRARG